jgi:hypothetical protein
MTIAREVTYAERLGWPSGTKVVIFHVDDVGMSHNSNMGAIKSVEDGIATSLSIMMTCPWVPVSLSYFSIPLSYSEAIIPLTAQRSCVSFFCLSERVICTLRNPVLV